MSGSPHMTTPTTHKNDIQSSAEVRAARVRFNSVDFVRENKCTSFTENTLYSLFTKSNPGRRRKKIPVQNVGHILDFSNVLYVCVCIILQSKFEASV